MIARRGELYDLTVCSGVIGTGLFLSSANSLRNGGPVGLLLGYIIVGTICYSVMVSRATYSLVPPLNIWSQLSIGEMISYLPIPGGQIKLAERFVDPAFSFVRQSVI